MRIILPWRLHAKKGAYCRYILDDTNAGELTPGAASNWWLHQSLTTLNELLDGKLA